MLGALGLAAVLGMIGLAVEGSAGYAAKIRNQRVADLAVLGAAVAYQAASQSLTAAQATANDIVVANGLAAGTATVTTVTVGTTPGIKVSITTAVPIRLAAMMSSAASYNVTNAAVASLGGAGTPACIVALTSSGNGVSVTGGTNITANACAVNTNATISSDNSSAKVTAKQIVAAAISDSAASYGSNAITTTPTANNIQVKQNGASDQVRSNVAVQAALCQVNKLTGTSDPDYPGGNTGCTTPLVQPASYTASGAADWALSYSPAANVAAYRTGNATYVIPAGSYTIGKLSLAGGITATFQGPVTLRIDSVDMSGNGMTIGDGSVTVVGTFGFNSGNTITIGNGAHSFGQLAVTGGRTLTLGSGNLNVTGAVTEDGGSTIYVGTAAGNTVTIGNDGAGTAINVAGGSYFCFTASCAAPSVAAGTFSANGKIATAGGSTLILPNAATHVINGDLNLNGSSTLGSGLYVIAGNFTNNTGGTMTGNGVTFALGGTFTLSGGTSLDLAAPPSGSAYGITDILVATKSASATQIGGGSADSYSGVFYAPYSAMTMSGGSSVSNNGSQCLMLTVSSLALSGSANITTSNCPSQSSGGGSAGSVALIQ